MPANPLQFGTNIRGAHALLNFRVPIDYGKVLGQNRVVFFGESHWQRATTDEMTRLTGDLSNAGFTHLALEAFNTGGDQRILDGMQTGSMFRTSTAKQLDNEVLPYLNVVEAAFRSGLAVVGIEMSPDTHFDCISPDELNTRFGWNVFEELYERSGKTDPFLPSTFFRNCYSLQVLEKIFASQGAKVAVFGGANHYMYSPDELRNRTTLNYLVEHMLGISGCVTYLVSSELPTRSIIDDSYVTPLLKLVPEVAREAGREKERFMIHTKDRVEGDRPDYVIHV